MNGKQTCKILKEIRRKIAEANDIEYVVSECHYKGNCSGTCPKCEAELRFLERQLLLRQRAGHVVTLLGLSAGVALFPQIVNGSESECEMQDLLEKELSVAGDSLRWVRGVVMNETGKLVAGATVRAKERAVSRLTEKDGSFEIRACVGDHLLISLPFPIYGEQELLVTENTMEYVVVVKEEGEIVTVGECPIMFDEKKKDEVPKKEVCNLSDSVEIKCVVGKKKRRRDRMIWVSGKVVDTQGNPLKGAVVFQEKGDTVCSGEEGKFGLRATWGSVLHVTYVGCEGKRVKVTRKNAYKLEVVLKEEEGVMGECSVMSNDKRKERRRGLDEDSF